MTEIDLADPQVLRALAHPARLRILDVVRDRQSATATQVSAALGESVASCSYHLRILAKYGFIRPAEHRGGREKPWAPASVTATLSTTNLSRADRARAAAFARAGRQSFVELLERWAAETDEHPSDWQEATFSLGYDGLTLTSVELMAMSQEVAAVVDRYGELAKDRPGAERVVFRAWGVPAPGNPALTEHPADRENLS